MATFENLNAVYGDIFIMAEQITVLFFGVDYVLRVLTAPELYPGKSRARSAAQYCLSATGIIDLLSFLPYYLPVFFPSGMAAFRMFRVVRILRLFRINAYYGMVLTDIATETMRAEEIDLGKSDSTDNYKDIPKDTPIPEPTSDVEQKAAAFVIGFHHCDTDAGLEPLYVQSGA